MFQGANARGTYFRGVNVKEINILGTKISGGNILEEPNLYTQATKIILDRKYERSRVPNREI